MEARPKKGAFGYNSKEVESYLIEISGKYESDIKAKDTEIAALNDKLAELGEKINGYEAERLSVADALVKAQKEAQDIMDAAVTEANEAKAKIEAECNEYLKKIEDAKKTLAEMQKAALKVMDDYRACVERFTAFDGEHGD
ncbi:MAG: hypothetical protein E7416_03530 [Ruminococcaceae bacterium]|nr:hypothetical protein [Oscillospiraceae bacterium]